MPSKQHPHSSVEEMATPPILTKELLSPSPSDEKLKNGESISVKSVDPDDDDKDAAAPAVDSSKLDTNNLDTDGLPVYDWESDEFRDIPEIVRETVSFEDDPTLPTITFRSLLLSSVFIIIGSFVSQLS
jgi:hypothetical protein